jgi:hypothetical protein
MKHRKHDGRSGIGVLANSIGAHSVALNATIFLQPSGNCERALQSNRRPWRPPGPIPGAEQSNAAVTPHPTHKVLCSPSAKLDSFTTVPKLKTPSGTFFLVAALTFTPGGAAQTIPSPAPGSTPDLPVLTALAISPTTVESGGPARVTMTLSGPAPSVGATITLSTNNSCFPVPPSYRILAGESSATFTAPSNTVTTTTTAWVTATYNGISQNAVVTVKPKQVGVGVRLEPAVSFGLGRYRFKEFNQKLDLEGNHPIHYGLYASLEIINIQLPKLLVSSPSVPVGLEFLSASSRTKHEPFTTVTWNLPVTGLIVAPIVPLNDRLYLRPIGVGYYFLGTPLRADLTVSGRAGRLEVTRNQVGFLFPHIGANLLTFGQDKDFKVFVEGGYRSLRFTNVSLKTNGGFEPNTGNLPEALDYSGFVLRVGVRFRVREVTTGKTP